MASHNGNGNHNGTNSTSLRLKTGLAEMLKGGVIRDVTRPSSPRRPVPSPSWPSSAFPP